MNIGLREATLNFDLKTNIGQEGQNSEVFIAHDVQFDAEIVIKRIPKKDFTSSQDYYKEAKCLYNSKHQNIVSVNYSCEDDEYIYIAMPFYGNGSLESILKYRYLTIREIIKYSIDFISGLNHIHTKGLIHFDIKPTNILISDSDEALVTDFGLAKFTNEHRIANQDEFYTLHKPPESLISNLFTIQSDIYQVGLTIYRMCNIPDILLKQLPENLTHETLNSLISSGQFPNRNLFFPHIPKKLRDVVRKAMSINPVDRYNNLIEMMNDLSKIDEFLDWNFCITDEGYNWKLDSDNKIQEVELLKVGETFNILSRKRMKNSGRVTKESNSVEGILESKIDAELKKILQSY